MGPLSFQILSESCKLELSRVIRRRLVAAKLALYEEEARLKQRLGTCVQLLLSSQPLIMTTPVDPPPLTGKVHSHREV